ncbi:uncharacterized protein CLIB1444_04S04082 [[Candida] jaroonii]|uniref:Uncharacterized protein n=1 Tax=[Candida] jaroonii TaxID=467808 RepID=A0ACA9Y6J7_9ASCO|nr:uncharacterized protein CLIB1444_04S04082 [[Candida] jaroonii]
MSIINFVGQFLKDKGYEKTFAQLELEYGKPIKTDITSLPTEETLEEILHDRINFKSMTNIEHDSFNHWKTPYPHHISNEIFVGETIVSIELLKDILLISTAKQKLILMKFNGDILNVYEKLIGVVIKKIITDGEKFVFVGGMDGKIYKFEYKDNELVKVDEVKVHRRLIVDMKYIDGYVLTLGFEKLVKLIDSKDLKEVSSLETMNSPVSIDGVSINNEIIAAVGYTDNTLIDIFKLTNNSERLYKLSISDAEFSTSNFTPRSIHFKQGDDLQLAIGTSHEPYMRVIIVSVDMGNPGADQPDEVQPGAEPTKIIRNKIIKNILTMSPQDKYSVPFIKWRQDSDGIWVGGDDGKIRGINLCNDEIIEIVGHDSNIKWLTSVNNGDNLVTVGDDRLIKIWK